MKPKRRLFMSTSHEMKVTLHTCEAASESADKVMALEHCVAAQAAFDDHDDTGCLEKCRTAIKALE